jgi:hypothetical protein
MSEVTAGQRFRDAKSNLFGHPPPYWVVDEVFIGTDRKEYAQVHSDSNPYDRKTLATAILRDKRRFVQGQLKPVR